MKSAPVVLVALIAAMPVLSASAGNQGAPKLSAESSWLKQCTKRVALLDQPFFHIDNCERMFKAFIGSPETKRSILLCEKQRKEIAIFCTRRSGRGNSEALHQIRMRGTVLKVLLDLMR